MNNLKIFFCIITIILYDLNIIAQVVFNEIMQSNVDYLLVDKDYPDSWIELYNPTDSGINLMDFSIGETIEFSSGYVIPSNIIIEPKGFLVVYCDKENNGLHTNFRLDSGKGDLYLFNNSGKLLDELHYKKMLAPNIAYGRITDGSAQWQFEIEPTAGSVNMGEGAESILPEPIFSIEGGVFYEPLFLTISIPNGELPLNTKIYITRDGSEPSLHSESDTVFSLIIDKTTIIRAKLMSNNSLSPRSVTHSYIYHPRRTELPIISIVSDSIYFYSEEYGILLGGNDDKTTNCYQGWRRPINMEFFETSTHNIGLHVNQLCETAVGGNWTRFYPQKSLKIYAHKRFGNKTFEGSFWEDKPDVTKVKSFMLRNGGSACIYGRINDAVIQKIFGTHIEKLDYQAYEPVILYINGEYKGIYGLRERSEEDYIESNYNGLKDIEIHTDKFLAEYNEQEHVPSLFDELYQTYMRDDVSYEDMSSLIDVENFSDVLITELFSTNFDWPQNNQSFWRKTTSESKWRWILKDIDYTALRRSVEYNMFDYLSFQGVEGSQEHIDASCIGFPQNIAKLYQVMLCFTEFRERLIDKFTAYLGDFLKPELTIRIISELDDEIFEEIEPTYLAYNDFEQYYGKWRSYELFDSINNPVDHYNASIEHMKLFWSKRPQIIYQQIADFFGLGYVFRMSIENVTKDTKINNVCLSEDSFEGCYYSNRALSLTANDDRYSWVVTIDYDDGESVIYKYDNNCILIDFKDYQKDNTKIDKVIFTKEIDKISTVNEIKYTPENQIIYNIKGYEAESANYNGIFIIYDNNKGETVKLIE